ncbi:ribosome biogenesis protein Rrp12 [Schizosaccharomyces japonicus yFS275]|uniref:Ribosome biogenesis protein Rrp12 n=1 Tax=Schizosaccharomyces japonicus (strain yFS275 / FY16936) TaxID=402676 RepID=B6K0C9_SCHJY|nr:ribosome biogenesis protein Rrp12 [Schizosaccharomyces japonicus yFS275]EEB06279.1 ribosome biogenesis protein Rrp12 [Schizosaccharomyces japonicus yFS275]
MEQAAALQAKIARLKNDGAADEHNYLKLVLEGVEASLDEGNTGRSPTAYLVSLLSLLTEHADMSKEIEKATVSLVELVLGFVPVQVLRAKLSQILSCVAPVMNNTDHSKIIIVHCIGILEKLLLAQETNAWQRDQTVKSCLHALLTLGTSASTRTQKAALSAVIKILRNPPPSPSLGHPGAKLASVDTLNLLNSFVMVLSSGNASAVEVQRTLHSLVLARNICLHAGWSSKHTEQLASLLSSITESRNAHLSQAAFSVFSALFKGLSLSIEADAFQALLKALFTLRPSEYDVQLLPSWLDAVKSCSNFMKKYSPDEARSTCFKQFNNLFEFLRSDSPAIRSACSSTLTSVEAAKQVADKLMGALQSIHFRGAWKECLQVVESLCTALHKAASPVMLPLLSLVGELRATDSFEEKAMADRAIGRFVAELGPEAVLSVLPLNLVNPSEGQNGRAWMLPILRDNIYCTKLGHFVNVFVPLSGVLFQRIIDLSDADSIPAKILQTLIEQIWALLPGYCYLPEDLIESFTTDFASILVNVLYQQEDLRTNICNALIELIKSNKAVKEGKPLIDGALSPVDVQKATANLEYLGSLSSNFLFTLMNVYSSTPSQYHALYMRCFNAWLSIAPAEVIQSIFDRMNGTFSDSIDALEGTNREDEDNGVPPAAYTSVDVLIALAPFVPKEALFVMLNYVQALSQHINLGLRKKAYKLLSAILKVPSREELLNEKLSEIISIFREGANNISPATQKDRLMALRCLFEISSPTLFAEMQSFLPEAVISTKEESEKARHAAFELLKLFMQQALNSSNYGMTAPERLERFVSLLCAGLAGSNSHMISATIVSITYVVAENKSIIRQEFLLEFLKTIDLLTTSRNAEVARPTVDFLKVSLSLLPADFLKSFLPKLVPSLLSWSHESKGHLRIKVKNILEKLIRRFGYTEVEQYVPTEDKRLAINIRKSRERHLRKRRERAMRGVAEPLRVRRQFASAYEAAVYDSESEESEEEGAAAPAAKNETFIHMGDEDEPLDLLDVQAISRISSTNPSAHKVHKSVADSFRSGEDGKFVFEEDQDGDADNEDAEFAERVADTRSAYLEAVAGADSFTRGPNNKIKFKKNKRGRDDFDEDMLDEDSQPTRHSSKTKSAKQVAGLKGHSRKLSRNKKRR